MKPGTGRNLIVMMALLGAGACSKSSSGGGTKEELEIFPPKLFAGFDGEHTYKAPAIVVHAKGTVTWTLADPSLAMVLPADNGEHVMLIAKKAGETTLTATAGDQTDKVTFKVYEYQASSHAIGESRYTIGPDGKADDKNPPCVSCHAPGKGPDHSPTELDADPDNEIVNTFLTGVDPEGRPVGGDYPDLLKNKGFTHMWKVSDAEKEALPSYLRSLEPMGYPPYDPEGAE